MLALLAFSALLPVHLDALAGRDPFVVDGAFVGGGTSWGLVLSDDEGSSFQRVCEEATGGAALLSHRVPDGRVLVATLNGMIETRDGGCSWAPVASVLANLQVSALVVAQDAPLVVYLSTSRAGAPNGVWKSVDGGATFAETALTGTINPLVELAVSSDGQAVAVSGFDLDENVPLLRASMDGGASFVSPTFAGINDGEIVGMRVLAVDTRVWLAVFTADAPKIMSADLALTALQDEGSFELDAVALVPFAGTHYALIRPGALYRREPADGSWSAIDEVTPSCLRRVAGDARLWVCTVAPAQFAVSDDGATFAPVLSPDEVEERACPADSFAAQVCVYGPVDPDPIDSSDDELGTLGFPDAHPVEDGVVQPPTDAPVGNDDNGSRTGCSGAGSGVPLAFVATLLSVGRRRARDLSTHRHVHPRARAGSTR